MKIAITCNEKNLDSEMDLRFGRCKYFLITEIENGEIINTYFEENEGKIQGHGAGIKASEQIGKLKIDSVITGALGPNATKVLDQLGIKAYKAQGNLKKVIDDFIAGNLDLIENVANAGNGEYVKSNNNKIIFFPLIENKGKQSRISEHFGHAPYFGIYEIETNNLNIIENNLDHTDLSKSPIDQIQKKINPYMIYAKSIGRRAIDIIRQKGILLKTSNDITIGDAITNINDFRNLDISCEN